MNSIEIANILLEAEPGDPDDLSPKDYALSSPGMENLMTQFFGQQNSWFTNPIKEKETWLHWNYGLTGKYVGQMPTKFPILADDTPFSFFTVDIFCNQLNKVPVPIHATIRLGGGANKDQRIPPTLPARNLRDLRVLLLKLQQLAQTKFEYVDDFYDAVEKLNTDHRYESEDDIDTPAKDYGKTTFNAADRLRSMGYHRLIGRTKDVYWQKQLNLPGEPGSVDLVVMQNTQHKLNWDLQVFYGPKCCRVKIGIPTHKLERELFAVEDQVGKLDYNWEKFIEESDDPDDIDPKQFAHDALNWKILLQQAGYRPLNQNTTTVWYKEIASQSDIAAERDATMEILVWAYPETVLNRNEGNFSQLAFGIEISKDGNTVSGQQSVTLKNLVQTIKTAERTANQWDDADYRSDEVEESSDPDDIDPKQFALNAFNFNIPGLHLHQDSPVRWHVYANYKMPRQEFMGFVYYDPDPLPPGANPEWDKLRWTASPLRPRKEQKAFSTMEKAIRYVLSEEIAENEDPDDIDPKAFAHGIKEHDLQKAMLAFYDKVEVHKDDAFTANASGKPLIPQWVRWTVTCARAENSPTVEPDWDTLYRAFLQWAAEHGVALSHLSNFDANGVLRSNATFQFTTFPKAFNENVEDVDDPQSFMQRMLPKVAWKKRLYEALWKFHPAGVHYQAEGIGNSNIIVIATSYFPPEKDHFNDGFFDTVKNVMLELGFRGELSMESGAKTSNPQLYAKEWYCLVTLGQALKPANVTRSETI